jgi:hypothetical protein
MTAAPITINDTYPWGRSLKEYQAMFSLSDQDMGQRIVSCADGPASFNAEMTGLGHRVTSVDPLYHFSPDEIRARIDATCSVMIDLARTSAHRFCWNEVASPDDMGKRRMLAMARFLDDYATARGTGRYLPGSLPHLAFESGSFDLALCSHFLFLYSHNFDFDFHLHSIHEMLRVAREVRIFPLLDMDGWKSAHLEPLMNQLDHFKIQARIERVDYEFQLGGNEMLRIFR